VNGNGQTIISNSVTLTVSARAVTTVTITGPSSVVAGQSTAAYSATAVRSEQRRDDDGPNICLVFDSNRCRHDRGFWV
jgi:hypothetical protein